MNILNFDQSKIISNEKLLSLRGGDMGVVACCVYLPDGTFAYSGNSLTGSCDEAGICTGCTIEICDEL